MNLQKLLAAVRRPLHGGMTPAATQTARIALIDTVGCMLAVARDPVISAVAQVSGESPLGRDVRGIYSSSGDASRRALVLGAQAHYLDFDDNFFPPIVHGSAVLFPALLAMATEVPISEARLLQCYCAGLEVQMALFESWGSSHYEAGWHATSTIGAISAAVACACALNLDDKGILGALSNATSFAGGGKVQFGSDLKPVHAGIAAQHGVQAALLAEAGVVGVANPFDGPLGMSKLFAAKAVDRAAVSQAAADGMLAIERGVVLPKLYPCCMSAHLGIAAALAMRETEGAVLKEADIRFQMPVFMFQNLPYQQPVSTSQARFSMHHAAAITILYGAPGLEHFAEPYLSDPEVAELRARISTEPYEASHRPDRPWGAEGVTMDITRPDGSVARHTEVAPAGAAENPLELVQIQGKFMRCVQLSLPEDVAHSLWLELKAFGAASRSATRWCEALRAGLPAPVEDQLA